MTSPTFSRYPGTPRVYVRLGIAPGDRFTLNDPELDQLDAGNLLEGPDGNLEDFTCQVTEASWRRGAMLAANPFAVNTGGGQVRIHDPDRNLDPANTSGPYYDKLRPGVTVDLYAIAEDLPSADRVQLFRGFLWSLSWSEDEAIVDFVDALAMLSRIDLEAGTATGVEGPIARASRILGAAGYPAAVRRLGTGTPVLLQSTDLAGNLLQQLQQVADSDFGLCYVDRNGSLAYGPGWWKARRVYGPNVCCDEIAASTVNQVGYDLVTNQVTVTAPDLTAVSAASQESIDRNGLSTSTVATLLTSTGDMTDLADYRLAWFATIPVGFPKLVTFCPAYDTGGLPFDDRAEYVARQYLDHIAPDVLGTWATIETSETVSWDATITGESHNIGPDYGWQITYGLTSNPNGWDQPHFTLDASDLGWLDYGNVLI